MTKLTLGHIGLTVRDLDRSEQFYRDLFGFETFFRVRRDKSHTWLTAAVGYPDTDIEFCHMRGNGLHLELLQYHSPFTLVPLTEHTYHPGHMHLCFLVDDIEERTERLQMYMYRQRYDATNLTKFAGRALDLDTTMITDGPQRGGKGYYLRDPDGHTIEVWQPAPGVPFGQAVGEKAVGA